MRLGVVVVAVVAVMGIAACGGDEAAAPLTLEQRVPGEAEAPGSKPDPVETPVKAVGVAELASKHGGSADHTHRRGRGEAWEGRLRFGDSRRRAFSRANLAANTAATSLTL